MSKKLIGTVGGVSMEIRSEEFDCEVILNSDHKAEVIAALDEGMGFVTNDLSEDEFDFLIRLLVKGRKKREALALAIDGHERGGSRVIVGRNKIAVEIPAEVVADMFAEDEVMH